MVMSEFSYEEVKKELEELRDEIKELKEILKDLTFLLAVDSTENMQVTENTSALLRGEVPQSCKTAHFKLREHVTEIASRWNSERARDLKKHLFGHE
jgi:archaellum component FlaC